MEMRIILVGAAGHMGSAVARVASETPHTCIAAGVDLDASGASSGFHAYRTLKEVTEPADVLIDFSSPHSLPEIVEFCTTKDIGAVLAATGYTEQQTDAIQDLSGHVPVFQAPNFSLGVALQGALSRLAAQVFGESCDIEIVERHHSRKVDAPSGTALSLAETVSRAVPGTSTYVYGRSGRDLSRKKGEIGIHAVRGGTLVGDHSVMFLAPDEEIEITHRAYSRDVFARGALAAANFIQDKGTGLYGMPDLLDALRTHSADTKAKA